MCGIVASWDRNTRKPTRLQRGLTALRHRGPDGEGMWLDLSDRRVTLGHVRLAVLDLEGSQQPIASEDGQVVIVVNGEFYDHDAIRRDLTRRGHILRTGGDSEIAVHLYEEYGIDFVHHLRGEFAFVLWDRRQRLLLAARDRFGIKPLCYHEGNRLLLASEAKALFALGVRPAWDEETFFRIASMQYGPPDRTLFAGVRQLPPGHLLIATDHEVRTAPYWDMDHPPGAQQAGALSSELIQQLFSALEEAVRLRLRSDVPVCCHLSGGLDSSTVAALARRHQPITCFTVGFESERYDELNLARRTADFLGADWHPLPLSQADMVEALGDAVWYSEGLAINGHLPAKFLLAKAIRAAGFKVVLSGEGADEIFGGYAHLCEDMRRATGEPPPTANAILAGMHLPLGEALPLTAVERILGFVPTFLHAKATLGRRLHSLLRNDFRQRFAGRDPYEEFVGSFDVRGQLAGRHPVDQASYLWSKSALAGYILRTLGDGTEMAHAVEGRLPFLDHHLFAVARALPANLKIRAGLEKWILRVTMMDLLPEEVWRRPKLPFTAPPLSLIGTALLEDTLRSAHLADVPFFDPGAVRGLLDRLPALSEAERVAFDPVLMLVLTACLAQQRFGL